MRNNSTFFKSLLFLFFLIPLHQTHATTVKPLNLNQMTQDADKIFRGEVIATESSSVSVGGGELRTTTYTLRVNDLIKGDLTQRSGKSSNIIKLQMIGSLKQPGTTNDARFVGGFKTPQLIRGNEYVLFTTTPSSVGLTMTVGVGQGLFSFKDGSFLRNEFNNNGLFRGMANAADFPAEGAIEYNALIQQIESLISQ